VKRCTLIIADAGPFNSLWVADQLSLIISLDMPILVVDAVYDELTSDLSYTKDRQVKSFIDANQPPFTIIDTEIGAMLRQRRSAGMKMKRNGGELAIVDFMSSADGLPKFLALGDPVALLYEDSDLRVINKPPHLHLLSTVGMLRGLERVGVIASADDVIHAMTHPAKPNRRNVDRRVFTDLPDGVDEPAAIGSAWAPFPPSQM
jgi:hypothetical protein